MSEVNTKVVLGVGVAMLVGMAYMTISSVSRNATESGRRYALPELREHLSEVRGLTLTTADNQDILTLKRDVQGWVVKEKDGYEADGSKINDLLRRLADARLLEAKTAIEQRYPELGVEDVKGPQAKGVKVTLEGLSTPVRLVIGNPDADPNRTFVRRAEERKVWLAEGNLQINRDPASWLDRNLVDIAPGRIAEIEIGQPGAKPLRMSRSKAEDAVFRLTGGAKGKSPEMSATATLPSALSGLTLLDVNQATQPLADARTLRYRTFDGLSLDIQFRPQDGACQARFSAALDQKHAEAQVKSAQALLRKEHQAAGKQAADTPLAVTDPAKDLQHRMQESESEAKKLQNRIAQRQFILPAESCSRFEPSAELLLARPAESLKPATGRSRR